MSLDEKSQKMKEELEKLEAKYDCKVHSPKSLDVHTQEWQYSIEPNEGTENIKVNVHDEYIDVFRNLPPERFVGPEQIPNAIEWIEGYLR